MAAFDDVDIFFQPGAKLSQNEVHAAFFRSKT